MRSSGCIFIVTAVEGVDPHQLMLADAADNNDSVRSDASILFCPRISPGTVAWSDDYDITIFFRAKPTATDCNPGGQYRKYSAQLTRINVSTVHQMLYANSVVESAGICYLFKVIST